MCDVCTKLRVMSEHTDDPELVAELEAELVKHQEEAEKQKKLLSDAEKEGPTRTNVNSIWHTICTGK